MTKRQEIVLGAIGLAAIGLFAYSLIKRRRPHKSTDNESQSAAAGLMGGWKEGKKCKVEVNTGTTQYQCTGVYDANGRCVPCADDIIVSGKLSQSNKIRRRK